MNYIKKLCVLKQLASGFAADGKKVSALLTAESFGGRLTLTLALIGFAPLSSGRYRCLVCDEKGQTEVFDTDETGATVKRESPLDIEAGLCCLVCFVGGKGKPAAFGKCGEKTYDVKRLCALLDGMERPAQNGTKKADTPAGKTAHPKNKEEEKQRESAERPALPEPPYDDEVVATENYYEFEDTDNEEIGKGGEEEKGGEGAGADEDAQSLFRFTGGKGGGTDEGACYYDKVKGELSALFEKYPAEEELAGCIPYSRWAKVIFSRNKYYTVGVICDEKKPRYICYGVPAESRGDPPDALKGYCSFLPLSVFNLSGKGYWMMFQDAETGECIKIAQK